MTATVNALKLAATTKTGIGIGTMIGVRALSFMCPASMSMLAAKATTGEVQVVLSKVRSPAISVGLFFF